MKHSLNQIKTHINYKQHAGITTNLGKCSFKITFVGSFDTFYLFKSCKYWDYRAIIISIHGSNNIYNCCTLSDTPSFANNPYICTYFHNLFISHSGPTQIYLLYNALAIDL